MERVTQGGVVGSSATGPPPRAHQGQRDRLGSATVLVVLGLVLFFPTGLVGLGWYISALRRRGLDTRGFRIRVARARSWAWFSISSFITVAIIVLAVLIVVANDHAVYTTFLNPPVIASNLGYLLAGFWINAKLFLVGEVVILVWSVIIAVVRELPGRPAAPLRTLAIIYIDVFRGLPAILVLLIIGLGLQRTGLPLLSALSDFQAALLALTLTYGAYMSEVIRAGMHSVHPSQDAASRSLGLSHVQTLRLVVLPQAIRNMIPPLLNGFISLQKDTALVSIIGVLDSVNRAQAVSSYAASLAPYAGVALFYLIITIPLGRLTDHLIKRNRRRVLAGG